MQTPGFSSSLANEDLRMRHAVDIGRISSGHRGQLRGSPGVRLHTPVPYRGPSAISSINRMPSLSVEKDCYRIKHVIVVEVV